MKFIGIEGTALAGKTTLIKHLRECMPSRIVVAPEYMHFAFEGSLIPSIKPTSPSEQKRALQYFAHIEQCRLILAEAQAAPDSIILLDRTVETLMAHVYALEKWPPNFLEECWSVLEEKTKGIPQPSFTLLLTASPEVIRARGLTLRDRPELFSDMRFISRFQEYFQPENRKAHWTCLTVDASQEVTKVLSFCLSKLEEICWSG
jgi:thymidylate kinase